MRPSLILLPLLLLCGFGLASAQQPVTKAAAPSDTDPAAAATAESELPLSAADMQELACVNEYRFVADAAGPNKVLLQLVVTSNACRAKGRSVEWTVSSDDGQTFVPIKQADHIKVRETARGVEAELVPDATYFFHPSVVLFKDVRTDGPVLTYPPSEAERAMAAVATTAAKP